MKKFIKVLGSKSKNVAKEQKGMAGLFVALALVFIVGFGAYEAFNWWKTSQANYQSKVDNQQQNIFNAAS